MLLHHEFVQTAKREGGKLAFIDRTLGRRISYARALTGALLLARRFRAYPDRYLGVMLPTSAGCALAILGALMAGKIPVMINYSTGAAENAEYAQRKCGFSTIVTSRALLEKLDCRAVEGMVFLEDVQAEVRLAEKLRAAAEAKLPGAVIRARLIGNGRMDDTAVVLFTSGSEMAPKAVELTHRNFYTNARACAEAFRCSRDDSILAILPAFHVFGQTTSLWLPLLVGMTMVTYANPLDFKTVARVIGEERPSLMVGTPYFLMGYAQQAKRGQFASLRLAVAGADKLPDRLRIAYRDEHDVEVFEGYGATETSPVISTNRPGANRAGSIGKPLPGVEVRIVDVETGEPVPAGDEGKILVRGDLVMKGYLGDLEATSLRIQDGWYETGDMGLLDEQGYLWHRGRLKRFIKVGGEMVSLVQVESELERVLPDEVECCAVEVPDARRGAVVGVALTRAVDERALAAELAKRLPPIAGPRRFFVIDELPKMGSGKIDFRATEEMLRDRPEVAAKA